MTNITIRSITPIREPFDIRAEIAELRRDAEEHRAAGHVRLSLICESKAARMERRLNAEAAVRKGVRRG